MLEQRFVTSPHLLIPPSVSCVDKDITSQLPVLPLYHGYLLKYELKQHIPYFILPLVVEFQHSNRK